MKAGAEIGDVAAGSISEEGISCRGGSANVGSMLLPGPEVTLPLELEPFATTLVTVAKLAFGKRSRSACVAFDWRSFDREHEGSENHGPQNSGCKPSSIAIETSDYVARHWNTPLCLSFDLFSILTWLPPSGYTLKNGSGHT